MTAGRKRSTRVAQLEQRRFEAARMFAAGARTIDVAQTLGVAWRTAFKWRQAFESCGIEGLRSRGRPGREPILDSAGRRRLRTILRAGARKSGYPDDVWTLARVHDVTSRIFGIKCSKISVWRMLRQSTATADIATRRAARTARRVAGAELDPGAPSRQARESAPP